MDGWLNKRPITPVFAYLTSGFQDSETLSVITINCLYCTSNIGLIILTKRVSATHRRWLHVSILSNNSRGRTSECCVILISAYSVAVQMRELCLRCEENIVAAKCNRISLTDVKGSIPTTDVLRVVLKPNAGHSPFLVYCVTYIDTICFLSYTILYDIERAYYYES